MTDERLTNPSDNMILQLHVIPEYAEDTNPALLDEISRELVDNFRSRGYRVQPVYTAEKSGGVFDVVVQLGQNIIAHKELLIALIGMAKPALEYLFDKWKAEDETDAEPSEVQPETEGDSSPQPNTAIRVSLVINEASMTIESSDIESAEDIIKLATRFQAAYPEAASNLTPQSQAQLRITMPKPIPYKHKRVIIR
jgi:hypothetical protein